MKILEGFAPNLVTGSTVLPSNVIFILQNIFISCLLCVVLLLKVFTVMFGVAHLNQPDNSSRFYFMYFFFFLQYSILKTAIGPALELDYRCYICDM